MNNEIILYQSNELPERIEVRIEEETVWLNQEQLSSLFQRDQSVISRHIRNVFREGELEEKSNMQKMHIHDSVFTLFTKRREGVDFTCYTKSITKGLRLDIEKHNQQYPPIHIKEFKEAHDRFLIIDGQELYHIGASLKDLGKKWFAFSKMDIAAFILLDKINQKK